MAEAPRRALVLCTGQARLHWSIPDPATAPEGQRIAAFEHAFQRLRQHIIEDLPA